MNENHIIYVSKQFFLKNLVLKIHSCYRNDVT